MATAKVFKSGNSQAVRLPKAFRVKSKEVDISRRGGGIVLRERTGTMARGFELLAALPADLTQPGRKKDKPPKRKGLWWRRGPQHRPGNKKAASCWTRTFAST